MGFELQTRREAIALSGEIFHAQKDETRDGAQARRQRYMGSAAVRLSSAHISPRVGYYYAAYRCAAST